MVSDVNITSVIREEQRTESTEVALAQDLDDFLNLLTVQLQNQDPLDPTDTDKLTDQITQFSQVEQQINTNSKLDDLLALELAGVSSIGLDYVGLDVSYLSSELAFDGETPVDITYALGDSAERATINILDESGNVVFTDDAPKSVGQNEYRWTGATTQGDDLLAEEGTYTIEINAFDADNNVIDSSTVVTGNVRGIENQNGTVFLLVGERAVPIANVLSASEPETITVDPVVSEIVDEAQDVAEENNDA